MKMPQNTPIGTEVASPIPPPRPHPAPAQYPHPRNFPPQDGFHPCGRLCAKRCAVRHAACFQATFAFPLHPQREARPLEPPAIFRPRARHDYERHRMNSCGARLSRFLRPRFWESDGLHRSPEIGPDAFRRDAIAAQAHNAAFIFRARAPHSRHDTRRAAVPYKVRQP